jgi:magnesium chelatase family protein
LNEGIHCNTQMSSKQLREICRIDNAGNQLLKTAMEGLGLSARAYDRILKVARTIADLDDAAGIETSHWGSDTAQELGYRGVGRERENECRFFCLLLKRCTLER